MLFLVMGFSCLVDMMKLNFVLISCFCTASPHVQHDCCRVSSSTAARLFFTITISTWNLDLPKSAVTLLISTKISLLATRSRILNTNSFFRLSTHAWLPLGCVLFSFFLNVCHSACIWSAALKLGYLTNLDMLFLVMGFISLIDEIQFMLISSRHICIRSINSGFILIVY